jgi:hypothetical protein
MASDCFATLLLMMEESAPTLLVGILSTRERIINGLKLTQSIWINSVQY